MMFNEKYLLDEYGIIKEDGIYLVPLCKVNTDYELLEDFDEGVQFYDTDFEDFHVNDNDVICVNVFAPINPRTVNVYGHDIDVCDYRLLLTNCDNGSVAYISYGGNLTDDGRYYVLCELAKMYKQFRNVIFTYYAIYTEEEVNNYVLRLQNV